MVQLFLTLSSPQGSLLPAACAALLITNAIFVALLTAHCTCPAPSGTNDADHVQLPPPLSQPVPCQHPAGSRSAAPPGLQPRSHSQGQHMFLARTAVQPAEGDAHVPAQSDTHAHASERRPSWRVPMQLPAKSHTRPSPSQASGGSGASGRHGMGHEGEPLEAGDGRQSSSFGSIGAPPLLLKTCHLHDMSLTTSTSIFLPSLMRSHIHNVILLDHICQAFAVERPFTLGEKFVKVGVYACARS